MNIRATIQTFRSEYNFSLLVSVKDSCCAIEHHVDNNKKKN